MFPRSCNLNLIPRQQRRHRNKQRERRRGELERGKRASKVGVKVEFSSKGLGVQSVVEPLAAFV